MKILIMFMIIFLAGCSYNTVDYDKYNLEDYPDMPTIGGQKLEKYKIENNIFS